MKQVHAYSFIALDCAVQHIHLPFPGEWNLLELFVVQDDRIVITMLHTLEKGLLLLRAEIVVACDEKLCARIQATELFGKRTREVFRHDHDAFMGKPHALGFHEGSCHLEGLAGADAVREERVAAVEDAGNGVFLVRLQRDRGVHARERQMRTVIVARHDACELRVVEACEENTWRIRFAFILDLGIAGLHPILKRLAEVFDFLLSKDGRTVVDGLRLPAVLVALHDL